MNPSDVPDRFWPARPEYLHSSVAGAVWDDDGCGEEDSRMLLEVQFHPMHRPEGSIFYEPASWPTKPATHVMEEGEIGIHEVEVAYLDLSDRFARACIALAYTTVSRVSSWAEVVADGEVLADPSIMVEDDSEPGGLALTPEARRMVEILCRMRMLDGNVTFAEAREATGWAEQVAAVDRGRV